MNLTHKYIIDCGQFMTNILKYSSRIWLVDKFGFFPTFNTLRPGGRLNIKMSSYQYRDPHVKDKRVSRPSYL